MDAGAKNDKQPKSESTSMESAQRAFEEHEDDLLRQLNTLLQRDIPEDATVREARRVMQTAMSNDPEARELIQRLAAIKRFGGGAGMQSRFDEAENNLTRLEEPRRLNRPPQAG
jgi:predicted nucleotidyltransferase